MGRLGVVMTFLAILFAAAPALEAAACVAEGCGAACLEPSAAEASAPSDASDPVSGGCTDDYCLCAVGHCHAASTPAPGGVASPPVSIAAGARIENEPLVSAVLRTLERPPRG